MTNKNLLEIDDFIREILKYSRIFFKTHFNSIGEIIFLGIRITLDFNFDALTRELEEIVNFFDLDTDKNDIIEKNVYDFRLEKRYMKDDVIFKKFIGFEKDSKINIYSVNIDLDSITCPMTYPILIDRKDLRNKLIQNRIFIAQYWPNVLDWVDKDSIEYRYASSILHLPIDQRYDLKEINIYLSLLKGFL